VSVQLNDIPLAQSSQSVVAEIKEKPQWSKDGQSAIYKSLIDRGFSLVPVEYKSKKPTGRRWSQQRIRTVAEAHDHFLEWPTNYGVRKGPVSGGLVDVDLDCPEAVTAAKYLLPESGLIHGRHGNPWSHWWYKLTAPIGAITLADPSGKKLLEVQPNGQTVVPPSIHESGEAYVWYKDEGPASVDPETFICKVHEVGAATLLARYWPPEGGRHDAALALAGGLYALGMKLEQAVGFVEVVSFRQACMNPRD
jgi:hypothetical protein